MVIEQRPGKKQYADPGPDWGVRVIEPGFPSAAGGWWDDFGSIGCCVGAWQARNAASYAAGLLDLSGVGPNLVEGNGAVPWNAANGWMFAAVAAQWLDTGITPVNNQTWSALIQYTNDTSGNGAFTPFGTTVAARHFGLKPSQNFGVIYGNGANLTVGPGLLPAGNIGLAGNQGYRNGVADGGAIPPIAGNFVNVYVGARNNNGVADQFISIYIRAAALYDCTLTAPQMAAVAAWMALI